MPERLRITASGDTVLVYDETSLTTQAGETVPDAQDSLAALATTWPAKLEKKRLRCDREISRHGVIHEVLKLEKDGERLVVDTKLRPGGSDSEVSYRRVYVRSIAH